MTETTSHWNYRVIEFTEVGGVWRAIHEVHYDDGGAPVLYSQGPATIAGETNAEMAQCLEWMRLALDKPALREIDFQRSTT